MYSGYKVDSESGLYYLNARYYAPGIGKFLTKDTFKGVSTDPQSLNQYAYCGGDPVNHVDPTGHYEDETGDPMYPFVTTGAGPADTGKLEFSKSDSAQGGSKAAKNLLTLNRVSSAVSVLASSIGVAAIILGAPEIVISVAGYVIYGSAAAGVLTTLGMRAAGDMYHGSLGNIAMSAMGFLSVPLLGGIEKGDELFNAAKALGFSFNIPLTAAPTNWN